MNIQQLLKQNKFETVWTRYCELHNVNEGEKEFLEHVYDELLNKEAKENIEKWTVESYYCEDNLLDEDGYFDITLKQENDEENYSLSYIDWDEVIGYDFNLNECCELTFISLLLYELTFYGDEEAMIKTREDLIDTVEGIKNGTIETFKIDDLDEFFKRLEEEDEDE